MTVNRRLDDLERQLIIKRRSYWPLPLLEQWPGQDITAELEEIRQQAEAAGWRPEDGPYVVVVELAEIDQ